MMSLNKHILVLQSGGTIDKGYPKKMGGYAFEIGDSAAMKIITRMNPSIYVEYKTMCAKDSQDVTVYDRNHLLLEVRRPLQRRILITHGTDTMIETAQFLAAHIRDKLIILTGAQLPETFKDSDADFNVGLALGALQMCETPGIYIAMNGGIYLWSEVTRDTQTGQFKGKL